MAQEQTVVAATPVDAKPTPQKAPMPTRKYRWLLPVLFVVGVALAGGIAYYVNGHKAANAATHDGAAQSPGGPEIESTDSGELRMKVDVVKPHRGGLGRTTTQPGSVIAYESADLFAKVSGYLKEQHVDYGDSVKEGQVVAVIDDPELEQTVVQARAAVKLAEAMVAQSKARVEAATKAIATAKAGVSRAKADVESTKATLTYRRKQYNRIKSLAEVQHAVEQQLVDEQLDQFESATAAHHAAQAKQDEAEAVLGESVAKLDQAKADLDQAKANVGVAQATLSRDEVLFSYTQIKSPYTGVITKRNFFRGDFIRSASDGGNEKPVLAVARTDKVRVIVRVPDLDVPYLNVDDPATVRIDALRGQAFRGKVSRFSHTESVEDRSMHTEIDLPNPQGKLRDGMYGGATIQLEPPTKGLTVPSISLIEQNEEGKGAVYVVKDGKAQRRAVRIGRDDGIDVEILEGLSPSDEVIVSTGSVAEGTPVRAEEVQMASSKSKPAAPPAH